MAKQQALRNAAEKHGIEYCEVPLMRGVTRGTWKCPESGNFMSVEEAVLAHFRLDGWRGYHGEGGLILNLIKSMSFKSIPPSHKATFVESIYHQHEAYPELCFLVNDLLAQVEAADKSMVERNFDFMVSRLPFVIQYENGSSTNTGCMLDFFPDLERWMFSELLEVTGNTLLHKIASKFSEAPYEYRRGWPDITMWKNGELRFVEVKAPGDKLRDSQKKIINEFAKPLSLQFILAGVCEAKI